MQAGRLDWERAWNELTPVEMAAWEGFAEVQPFGPGRDDLRMRHMVLALIRAIGTNELDEADCDDINGNLDYMKKFTAKPTATKSQPVDEFAETRAHVDAVMRGLGGG